MLEFRESTAARGVVERRFDLSTPRGTVPGVLWTPDDEAARGKTLVLLGHGGGETKSSDWVVAMARRLVRHSGFAAVAIDAVGHGDRMPGDWRDRWRGEETAFRARYLGDEAMEHMVDDWRETLGAVQAVDGVGHGPVGYWGLSMGTRFGVPLAAAEPCIAAAVFGLMGLAGMRGDAIPRLDLDAPRVVCPVLFLQQLDDELIPSDSSAALFGALGSKEKRLHANPGRHGDVPRNAFDESEHFLAEWLSGPTPAV